jgi:hypothetical protein
MHNVTDFLDQKRSEITKRLNELQPLVDEYQRLEAASSALQQVTGSARRATRTTARRGPGRPAGARATTATRRRGRPAGTARATRTTRARRTTGTRRTASSRRATPSRRTTAGRRTSGTRSTSRAATGATATTGRRRAGRRRGSGARTAQTLQLVNAQPSGITIPELAAKMGIKQNYLYRVLPALQKEGKVRKRGRTWLPR